MIAAAAIHCPASRITGKPAFERGSLDPLVELEARIERLAAGTIGDQLDGLEQAAPANIADMAGVTEALRQPPPEATAEIPDPFEQLLFTNNSLHPKPRRPGRGGRGKFGSRLE